MARWRWGIVFLCAAALGAWAGKAAPKQAKSKYPPGSGRPRAGQCAPRAPGKPDPNRGGSCKTDADCKGGKEGRCNPHSLGMHSHIAPPNSCGYSVCASDADCKTGGPCECDDYSGNFCLAGNCQTDADCGKGGACGRSNEVGCNGGPPSYFCRTPKDTCTSYQDCDKGGGRGGDCVFVKAKGHFACQEHPRCPVG